MFRQNKPTKEEQYVLNAFGNIYGSLYVLDTQETEKGHLYIIANYKGSELYKYSNIPKEKQYLQKKVLVNFIVYSEDKLKETSNPRLKMLSGFTPPPITHNVNNLEEAVNKLKEIFNSDSQEDLDEKFKELRIQFRMDGFLPRIFFFEDKLYIVSKTSFGYSDKNFDKGTPLDLVVKATMIGTFANLDKSGKRFSIEANKTYLLIGRTHSTEMSQYTFPFGLSELYLSSVYTHTEYSTKSINTCKVEHNFTINRSFLDPFFGGYENYFFYGREEKSNLIIPTKIMSLETFERIFSDKGDDLGSHKIENLGAPLEGFSKSVIVRDKSEILHIIQIPQENKKIKKVTYPGYLSLYETYMQYVDRGVNLLEDENFIQYRDKIVQVKGAFEWDLKGISFLMDTYVKGIILRKISYDSKTILSPYEDIKHLVNTFGVFCPNTTDTTYSDWVYFFLNFVAGSSARKQRFLDYVCGDLSHSEEFQWINIEDETEREYWGNIFLELAIISGIDIVPKLAYMMEQIILNKDLNNIDLTEFDLELIKSFDEVKKERERKERSV